MMSTRRPKHDIEMHFKWENKSRYIFVNVKECPVCADLTVFLAACKVCGRFSSKDRPIYFQPARIATLTPVERDLSLDGIDPPPPAEENVKALPMRLTPTNSDDGPEAN